ncbi:SdpI family protein [Haladaptatus pallidirubidus]|nr:SdpI family protein [Haladaptatus pallidirubidus]
MNRVERNWFVGVRTSWTLSNDEVWKSTPPARNHCSNSSASSRFSGRSSPTTRSISWSFRRSALPSISQSTRTSNTAALRRNRRHQSAPEDERNESESGDYEDERKR